jgi:hypothetical protein
LVGNKRKFISLQVDRYGYMCSCLSNNNHSKVLKVHRLVLLAFKPIDNSQEFECNHIDGNKFNNYIDNLEWCTGKENTQHAIKIGLINNKGENHPNYGKHRSEETKKKLSEANSGEKHPMFGKKRPGDKSGYHVLSEEKVLNIKLLLSKGIMQKDIAKIYKVDPSVISNINTGKTWNHIQIKEDNENEK